MSYDPSQRDPRYQPPPIAPGPPRAAHGQQPPAYGQQQPAYGQPTGGWQPPPVKAKRKGAPWWLVAVVGVVAMVLGAAVGAAAAGDKTPTTTGDTVAQPPAAGETTTAGKPAAPTTAGKPTKAKPTAVTITEEGVLLVGSEVKPGTYRATVPEDSVNCYWARLKGTSGSLDDLIANGNGEPKQRMVVTIHSSDKAFEQHGCGTWTRIG
jgi:hypothetical protein